MSFAGRCAQLAVVALIATAFAAAQQTGGAGTGNTGGGKGAPTVGTTPSPPVVQPRNIPPIERPSEEQHRVIFLTGAVVYDDGTAAPSQVAIERVCNGRARREGFTDSTGHFSITLGRDTTVVQDASVGGDASFGSFGQPGTSTPPGTGIAGGVSERDLMNCELRASAPGAWSDVILLAGRRSMDDPNVGTIVLHRLGKVEGTRVSVVSMQAPKDARKAFAHGEKAVKKQKWEEAQQDFEKAVAAYPRYADALVELGVVYGKLNRAQDARKAFEQALSIDPKFILPYFHLAVMAAAEKNWQQVAELTDRALTLDAYEYPAAWYYNSVAYFELHKLDQAEKSARTARRLDSQYRIPKIDLVLSSVLLQRGDFSGAAQQLREFLKRSPSGEDADRARAALNDAEQKIASQR